MPTLTTDGVAAAIVATFVSQGVTLADEALAATEIAGHLTAWLGGEDAISADLSLKLSTAIGSWNTNQLQFLDWSAGVVDGGPEADGRYPLTNAAGVTRLFPCIAKIFAIVGTVGDPAAVVAEVEALVAAADAAKTGSEVAAATVVDIVKRSAVPGGALTARHAAQDGKIAGYRRRSTGAIGENVERIRWRTEDGGFAGETRPRRLVRPVALARGVDANGRIGWYEGLDGVRHQRVHSPGATTIRGQLDAPVQNLARLRRTRNKLGAIRNGLAAQWSAAIGFDSWTDATSYYTKGLYDKLISATYGNGGFSHAGAGFIGFSKANAAGASGRGAAAQTISVTRDASWTDVFTPADGSVGTPQPYPDLSLVAATTPNATITITGSALTSLTALTLIYEKGAAADYSWNGGSTWTTLTMPGGAGPATVAIPLTGAASPLKIRETTGAGRLNGLIAVNATSGIRLHRLACSGSTAAQWAGVNATDFQTSVAALSLDFVGILGGLNDAKGTGSAQDCANNIETMISRYRAAAPGCDVLVTAPPEVALNTAFGMDDLSPLLREVAFYNDAAFMDLQPFFGPLSRGTPYAAYDDGSANPYLLSDHRHPSNGAAQTGQQVLIDAFYRALVAA